MNIFLAIIAIPITQYLSETLLPTIAIITGGLMLTTIYYLLKYEMQTKIFESSKLLNKEVKRIYLPIIYAVLIYAIYFMVKQINITNPLEINSLISIIFLLLFIYYIINITPLQIKKPKTTITNIKPPSEKPKEEEISEEEKEEIKIIKEETSEEKEVKKIPVIVITTKD